MASVMSNEPRAHVLDHVVVKDPDVQQLLHSVLGKLQNDPSAITTEDARRLHEHYDVTDEQSAKIISAVEVLAEAHNAIVAAGNGKGPAPCSPRLELLTLVQDLMATVDSRPSEVTVEVLRLAQAVVSRMQKAVGHTNAPHPELEGELQEEYKKIEAKVEQGTVTKEEANHLHSLEARAHGHTERGGLTATAQSVAAKRERTLSLSEGSVHQDNSPPEASPNAKAREQSHKDKEANLEHVVTVLRPKVENEPEKVTKEDAALLQSREARAHGSVEKCCVAAAAMSLADKNDNKASEAD